MGGRGSSSGKASAEHSESKQQFTGRAEIDGFEFNEWSRGDRIYYGDISKRRRNGLIPSEGYIDMDTGEIVKEGNWAGYEAAKKFLETYDYQTPGYKAKKRRQKGQKKYRLMLKRNLTLAYRNLAVMKLTRCQ